MIHEHSPASLPLSDRKANLPAGGYFQLILLVAMTCAAYASSLVGAFVLDDVRCLDQTTSVRTFFPPAESIAPGLRNRPVVRLTLAANYALHGKATPGYHAVNLLIHLAAALLLFDLVRRAALVLRPNDNPRHAAQLAFAIALLWAVHPLGTQAVTYIIQRTESLMAAFYLATLYAVLRGATARSAWPWYLLAVVLCALGMGTKEVMITAPVVTLLFDRAMLSQSWRELSRRRWGLYLLLAATWVISIVQIQMAFRTEGNAQAGFHIKISSMQYLLTQPEVIWHYLRLSLVPYPLCFDYHWPVEQSLLWSAIYGLPLLALLVYFVICLQKMPVVGYCVLAFFLVLAPTSSIMPINDLAVEHRMYLPLACVLTLVALAMDRIWQRIAGTLGKRGADTDAHFRQWNYGILLIAVVLAGLTFQRNLVYRSAYSVWTDTVAKAPNNPRAHENLGVELLRLKRYDEAIAEFSTAMELGDTTAVLRFNRGTAYLETRQWDKALVDLDAAEAIKPGTIVVALNRGRAHHELHQFDKAIEDFSAIIKAQPDHATATYFRGLSWQQSGDHAAAIRDFTRCIEIASDHKLTDPAALQARAKSYRALGDDDRAEQDEAAAEKAKNPAPS